MIILTSISQSKPDLLKNELLQKHIEELGRKSEEARGRHEGLVRVAEQEEEKARRRHHQPDHEHISQPLDDGREIDHLDEPTFCFIGPLGSPGRFGEVHEVKELSTRVHYARKRIEPCSPVDQLTHLDGRLSI